MKRKMGVQGSSAVAGVHMDDGVSACFRAQRTHLRNEFLAVRAHAGPGVVTT